MWTMSTDQQIIVHLNFRRVAGDPSTETAIQAGSVVPASSDETVFTVAMIDDMTAKMTPVAPNQKDGDGNDIPVQVTFTADADPGAGVFTITGFAGDGHVTMGTGQFAQVIELTLDMPMPRT